MNTMDKGIWSPPEPRFTDPLGRWIPELERCLVRRRSIEFVLIPHHAEELKRTVIATVETQATWRRPVTGDGGGEDGGEGRQGIEYAFDWLVAEGVLTTEERARMVALIGRRNEVAHHLDQITADLSIERRVRE